MVESSLHVKCCIIYKLPDYFRNEESWASARAFLSDLVNREKEIQRIPLVFSIIFGPSSPENEPTYCSFYSSCFYFDLRGQVVEKDREKQIKQSDPNS